MNNLKDDDERWPMVSVVVPVRNVAPYVDDCLRSVVGQTYADLEAVVVDDGSTDGSGAICDEAAALDGRVRVVHTENGGLSAARNLGMALARGEYVLFLDADDWMEPGAVGKLVGAARATGSDVVACRYVCEWLEGPSSPLPEPAATGVMTGAEAVCSVVCNRTISESAWGKLFRRRLLSSFQFSEGRLCEDVEGVWRILDHAERVCCIADAPFHYRMRSSGIMRSLTGRMLADRWLAFSGRRKALASRSSEFDDATLRDCAWNAALILSELGSLPASERDSIAPQLADMRRFAWRNASRVLCLPVLTLRTRLAFPLVGLGDPLATMASFALGFVRRVLGRREGGTCFP